MLETSNEKFIRKNGRKTQKCFKNISQNETEKNVAVSELLYSKNVGNTTN
jgi:hypothetical protein